jgi:hypothetical protein
LCTNWSGRFPADQTAYIRPRLLFVHASAATNDVLLKQEVDKDLHSRTIAALGEDVVKAIAASNVLISGLNGNLHRRFAVFVSHENNTRINYSQDLVARLQKMFSWEE